MMFRDCKKICYTALVALSLTALPVVATAQDIGPGGTAVAEDRNDDDTDWGWIGLAGLLGLAGLMRRDRHHDAHRTGTTTR